jgi:hypothetical protein
MYGAPYRFWELLIFSTLITIVLTIGVIACLLAKIPFFRRAVNQYMNDWHGGVYIVNISDYICPFTPRCCTDGLTVVNNKMFGLLSGDEIDLAKDALAASKSADHKEFNLDIAKLLFVPPP